MAVVKCVSNNEERKSRDTSDYDPELDFFSEKFDALKALMTPGLKPPVANAGVLDNLNKYESEMLGTSVPAPQPAAATSFDFKRRFLPHQMPVRGERRFKTNVLTKMADMTGPLEALKRCVEDRIRIKVYTRNSHEVRGYCLAYVAAFDKHWNLALEDVTEIWTRRRKKKVPPLVNKEIQEDGTRYKTIIPPKIVVTIVSKKIEKCERHVPQLLVRGEEIVMVVIVADMLEN